MDSATEQLHQWLAEQSRQTTLRFITCGSVDDGKSTLIGRLLWESQQIFDDQMAALSADSRRHGTQGEAVDLALLVDGLAAEREQGITIDVAYRFFSTPKRKFIVADTPGHEQYTRNMVTGASTADVAVILINAKQGIQVQTRRHAYLVSLMGIRHVVVAINKMDTVDFDAQLFNNIERGFRQLAEPLSFASITAIPLSALNGDNITARSSRTHWYNGPTLMGYLETVDIDIRPDHGMLFPVQWVCRPNSNFRGFAGSLAAGSVQVGDEVRITASGQTAKVKDIVTFDGSLQQARSGDAVTLVLDREIDASRGDIFTLADKPLDMTDQFTATLIWLHEEPGLVGRSYELKLANQWAGASITDIKHRVNVNNGALEPCKQLELNDISQCNVSLSRALAFAPYDESQALGSFLLVDRFSQATVAAGMIQHNLRRAQNVHRQALSIGRAERERLNGHKGKVIWFTGLSGSGKSTIANALEKELYAQGKRTYILDGDNIRQGLNKDLGFTDADRVENIRRVAEVAKLMMDAGLIVLTAFISPFRAERKMARELIGEDNFIEVYVDTPLEVCEERDPKGLYKKAHRGELPNMTGVNSPYEAPMNPDVVIKTEDCDVEASVDTLLVHINRMKLPLP
ncbi:MAG TPA: sulfate adenylyltransferase subunit CysN [Burkholderiaceae bacterium]|nr:sulfate adenylyltransferase subunit CysN [Burkholderiaceae bacterium]